jgi:transcriptional regulator with PAS, ATPase and Fis domain
MMLQNRQVVKFGANRPVDIDIRIICATNMLIYDLIEKNEFRQDLLYRINTIEINIPPLRNRLEDIQILLGYFLDKHKKKYMKNQLIISDATINALKQYKWPGNVRELEHATERAVIMCNTRELKPSDFLPERSASGNATLSGRLTMNVHEVEQQLIDEVVRKFGGNLTKASKELGMGRTTLYRKLKNAGNT